MKTIYGPVPSWRLGRSLGVDVITRKKICSFDCIYCQLGKKDEKTVKRRKFVEIEKVKRDLLEVIDSVSVDVITFSGMGEPTLASNLGEMIEVVREITDLPLAILTNSSLLYLKEVRRALNEIDKVIAKLDVPDEELLQRVNRPHQSISFEKILKGIKEFRKGYKGKLELQMMFIDENKGCTKRLARLASEITPERVEINTPLRPSPVNPLGKEEIKEIKEIFEENGLDTISVYESERIEAEPLNYGETLRRRPG
ncbi:MAG: radical SAM protein [Candidatus Syntropharchaeia archaeon]